MERLGSGDEENYTENESDVLLDTMILMGLLDIGLRYPTRTCRMLNRF